MIKSITTAILLCAVLVLAYYYNYSDYPKETINIGEITEEINPVNNSVAELAQDQTSAIYFTGDIMLARDVERRIINLGDKSPFSNIVFEPNSWVIANFESAIPSEHIPTPNNTFKFSTRKEYLTLLKKLGVTHLSLANNHSYDFGLAGYNHTVSSIWDYGMTPFGHPSQISSTSVKYLETNNIKLSIIAIHTLYNQPNLSNLYALLKEMRENSDWQVAYIHWGDEYVNNINREQEELAAIMIDNGIDLIVGHHPHVVQGITRINETVVVPSLGNFIFDQYFSDAVQEGLLLRLSFEDRPKLKLLPITSKDEKIKPRFMTEAESLDFLSKLASSSDDVLQNDIITGEITL